MRIAFIPWLVLVVLGVATSAQRGVAPNGYYPSAYRGDMFTGRIVSVDAENDILTLEYRKDSKTDSFSVTLEGGCSVPSKTGEPMHARNIPQGTVLRVLYMPKSVKEAGEKKKMYVAIGIEFVEWMGKPVAPDKRRVFRCAAGAGWNEYRSFSVGPGGAVLSPNDLTVHR